MAASNPEFMRPLTIGWLNKINLAKRHKKERFQDVADQCMYFYAGAVDFMYSKKYQQKYLKGSISPKFQICLQKAFEFVALIGPLIYNRNPHRNVRPYDSMEFTPLDFGDPNDPNVQAVFQQAQMQEVIRSTHAKTRCSLVEKYLNYTSREQPGGGLKQAGEFAATEALIKGRGLLWPYTYSRPGSGQTLTGLEYDTVDRLLIDPDAESSAFGKAFWISREHFTPHWIPERKFKLPFGSLRNKIDGLESVDAQGASKSTRTRNLDRQSGRTFDLTRWYEIWSIGGV